MRARVTVAAPAWNRAWILPKYLEALDALDYPPELLSFFFLVNDSTDASFDILEAWASRRRERMREALALSVYLAGAPWSQPPSITVVRADVEPGRPPDIDEQGRRLAAERSRAHPILADLRNRARSHFLASPDSYLWMVDTDILVPSDALRRLLAHGRDVVAALVRNGEAAWNYLTFKPHTSRFDRDPGPPPARLFQVDLTGACCLFSRRALATCKWRAVTTGSGEDAGMALALRSAGISQWVDGSIATEHVMKRPAEV
jgi:hypothetical protein